jgi:cytoskeletal protein CcmA (bactofilin family)
MSEAAAGNTVVGSDASFKGEIAFEGTMRIDGKFEGKIQSKGKLSIGRTADVQAEVNASHVAIEGGFRGNLSAQERVEIAASARVNGDIRATKLVVAEGATLVGNVQVSPDALKSTPAAGGRPGAGVAVEPVGARR